MPNLPDQEIGMILIWYEIVSSVPDKQNYCVENCVNQLRILFPLQRELMSEIHSSFDTIIVFSELQMPTVSTHYSVDHRRLLTQRRPGADSDGSLGSACLASDHVQRSANHPARVSGRFAK